MGGSGDVELHGHSNIQAQDSGARSPTNTRSAQLEMHVSSCQTPRVLIFDLQIKVNSYHQMTPILNKQVHIHASTPCISQIVSPHFPRPHCLPRLQTIHTRSKLPLFLINHVSNYNAKFSMPMYHHPTLPNLPNVYTPKIFFQADFPFLGCAPRNSVNFLPDFLKSCLFSG